MNYFLKGNKKKLKKLAQNPEHENEKLIKLKHHNGTIFKD